MYHAQNLPFPAFGGKGVEKHIEIMLKDTIGFILMMLNSEKYE